MWENIQANRLIGTKLPVKDEHLIVLLTWGTRLLFQDLDIMHEIHYVCKTLCS